MLPVIALVTGVLADVRPARAQDDAHRGAFPEKNSHVFVPTAFIPDAFVNTQLTINLGYWNTIATDFPILGPGGQQIGAVEGDLLFLGGGFEFSCAVREWIGFFARFQALARTGGNTPSILASGLSAASGFGLGWEFRLWEDERSMLSGSVEVNQTSVTFINVASFVGDPNAGLSQSYTPLATNFAVRYAYGISDLIGLSAFGDLGHGEVPDDTIENRWFYRLGGAASFNLARRSDVPLGFAAGLRTSSYPLTFENTDGNAWSALASIAYMGRPDFVLTLDTEYEWVPINYQDLTVGYAGVTIGLQYSF